MEMQKKYLAIILGLLALGGAFAFMRAEAPVSVVPGESQVSESRADTPIARTANRDTASQISQDATPPANSKAQEGDRYEIPAIEGATVLDAMKAYRASGSFDFTGREYAGIGFFVESINGRTNANRFYWFLYVNGASSPKGASETTLKASDRVEWRYEKSSQL